MSANWSLIIIIAVIALVALAIGTVIWTATRQPPPPPPEDAEPAPRGQQAYFIINPSKDGSAKVIEEAEATCAASGLPAPIFLETTILATGEEQAREALRKGADVVIVAGGDGTVRAAATGMVGSGVPLGIIPVGTGNLFARNLDLPIGSVPEALEVALFGRDRVVDVGWAEVTKAEVHDADDEKNDWAHAGDKELFLVIAGLGFDAAMITDTTPALKQRVGWIAYFMAGMKHLYAPRLQAVITVDDRAPVDVELRTIMVGNCGLLPGGLTLLPDARIDDGIFDIAAIDTRGGLAGWFQLFGEVVMQGAVEKSPDRPDNPWRMGQIDVLQGRKVRIAVAKGKRAQVDGDPMGRVLELLVWVDPGALVVRGI